MKNVLELLERTAARLPRQIAFADQQCSYDYQTVANIAESVGSALAANGDRNCPVAVLMERGAPCLVTLMGGAVQRQLLCGAGSGNACRAGE